MILFHPIAFWFLKLSYCSLNITDVPTSGDHKQLPFIMQFLL